ncbi:polysaccharide deacetylase family protein [Cryptosporangium arvum]|uniref:polysaccharide deacetylase family protein n=1 Tax=Cryptosporangium arvum TaxID=80871 RepID=UPI0004B2FB8E|nr:polysaccharide deacetylase family protein [Cryptosporangium arvum]
MTALPILMYHGVPAEPDAVPDPLRVPAADFRAQISTLTADGWELLGLTEALGAKAADPDRPVVALTFDDAYDDFLNAAAVLAEFGARSTLYVPTGSVGSPGYLGWDQLGALAAAGVEIGSHSRQHHPMDTLPPTMLGDELVRSRAELTARLDVPIRSFCYPHGYSNGRARRAVADAGYLNACVIGRRLARPGDDRFALPRLQPLPGMSRDELRWMVASGEPGLSPVVKRALQPAWRLARLASTRVLMHELT